MKREEIAELMASTMYLVTVFGKQHVVTTNHYRRNAVDSHTGKKVLTPEANYMRNNRGQALCGILKEGETLEEFRENWKRKKVSQVMYAIK